MITERVKSCEKEPRPKTAWLFPGQGAQSVGMGKALYENDPQVKKIYDEAGEILGYPISKISFEGPPELLNQTRYTQPATFVLGCACLTHGQNNHPEEFSCLPDLGAGQSFGMITLMVAAGSVSFVDGLKIVDERAKGTQKAAEEKDGGMMVVKAGEEDEIVQDLLNNTGLELCAVNAKDQVVIGGPKDLIIEAKQRLKASGVVAGILKVSGAFHTSLMKDAVEDFKLAVEKCDIKDSRFPILSNITAELMTKAEQFKQELPRQLIKPVRWKDIVDFFGSHNVSKTIEFGAKNILSDFNQGQMGGTVGRNDGLLYATVWER